MPLEGGLPVESAAVLVARAFAAYAKGDWEMCDRLVARGCGAWGESFTEFVGYAVSPAFSSRPADPAWDAFRARLAVTVLSPGPQEPARRPGRHGVSVRLLSSGTRDCGEPAQLILSGTAFERR